MQIPAVEKWLAEGWSLWRIGYGAVALVATAVAVYGYVIHPDHPGAVWWLLAAICVITAWAVLEAVRWRIRYHRLLASQQAEPPRVRWRLRCFGFRNNYSVTAAG